MLPRVLLACALGLACALPAAAAPARLRVVSFNVWGLPAGLAEHRPARIARIGPAIAALHPDVVLLQEVWRAEDGERLRADLAAAGLTHALHVDEGFLGSGLLLVSRYPLESTRFTPFEATGKPHKPFHGDWYARKGVVVARVTTPAGVVLLADTHLHARYGTDEYLPVQTAQALQVVEAVGDLGVRPPTLAGDPARPPLVLTGDLNSRWGSLPLRLVLGGAALRPVDPDLGIDWILVRDGGALRVRVRKAAEVLTEAVDLGEGVRAPLSDHPAVLADLELLPAPAPAGAPAPEWPALAAEADALLAAAEDASALAARRARRLAVLLLLATGAAFALGRRRRGDGQRRRLGCLGGLVVMALLHAAVWALYLGAVYEPQLQAGLRAARARLATGP